MNKKTIKILSGVLVGQVLLFLLLSAGGQLGSDFAESVSLLGVDLEQVDLIKVTDEEKKIVELRRVDGHWQLPSYFDFPVSEAKISEVIGKLNGFKVSWPVGQTMIAAKQFQVVDEQFERKVEFSGKAAKTIFLGSSPSFKKVHARVDPSKNTYSIDFNAFDVPNEATGWMDKKYYELQRSQIKALSFNGINFDHQEGNFVLKDIAADRETDALKVNPLISSIINPDFEAVLGREDQWKKSYKDVLSYKVEMSAGETIVFDYKELPETKSLNDKASKDKEPSDKKSESEFLILKVSKYPYVFKVRRARVANLIKAKADELTKAKVAQDSNESNNDGINNETTGSIGSGESAATDADAEAVHG